MDDVFCLCSANGREVTTLKELLQLFNKATRLEVNERKLELYLTNVSDEPL